MKVTSYNARILNPQEQKLSTLDCELLGIVHDLQIYEFLILDLRIQFTYSLIINLCYIVLQKNGNLNPRFHRAQMQLTKFSKIKIIHIPGKNLSPTEPTQTQTTSISNRFCYITKYLFNTSSLPNTTRRNFTTSKT